MYLFVNIHAQFNKDFDAHPSFRESILSRSHLGRAKLGRYRSWPFQNPATCQPLLVEPGHTALDQLPLLAFLIFAAPILAVQKFCQLPTSAMAILAVLKCCYLHLAS